MRHLNRRDFLAGSAAMAVMPGTAFAAGNDFYRLGLAEPAFAIEPKLDLPDLGGTVHTLSDYSGKILLVSFWATWCGPCRRAMPELDRLQKKYKDELAVLGVAGQNDPIKDVKKYTRSHNESYGQLYDENQAVYRSLRVSAIPHVVVMSTDGIIRWQGNPLSPSFKKALEQVIKVDPMIKALAD